MAKMRDGGKGNRCIPPGWAFRRPPGPSQPPRDLQRPLVLPLRAEDYGKSCPRWKRPAMVAVRSILTPNICLMACHGVLMTATLMAGETVVWDFAGKDSMWRPNGAVGVGRARCCCGPPRYQNSGPADRGSHGGRLELCPGAPSRSLPGGSIVCRPRSASTGSDQMLRCPTSSASFRADRKRELGQVHTESCTRGQGNKWQAAQHRVCGPGGGPHLLAGA